MFWHQTKYATHKSIKLGKTTTKSPHQNHEVFSSHGTSVYEPIYTCLHLFYGYLQEFLIIRS
jgi:hypothetical protein